MFARAAGRVARCSTGVAVLQGTCHPPLAANTVKTPRHWKETDQVCLLSRVAVAHLPGIDKTTAASPRT